MILVKITLPLYIRKGSGTSYGKIGVAPASGNNTVTMDGVKEDGEAWKGITKWYYKINDKNEKQWYWGGRVQQIEANNLFVSQIKTIAKQSFSWFKNLEIENIWNTYNEYGDKVTVAILDTGYNVNNEDLNSAVIEAGISNGSSFIPINDTKSQLINDSIGHGTFCASVIGARNANAYNIGIAPKSKLLIGKISDDGGLDPTGLETILNGIDWAVKLGAEIISISFGKFPNEIPMDANYLAGIQDKLNRIIQKKNVLIFASSGDNIAGTVLQKERYPASLDGCISIGATNNGLLSEITILSSKTIIHAQGIDVESYYTSTIPEKKSGTSMSTPIVAGIAALAISYLKKKNNDSWNANDLLQKIYNSAVPIINTNNKKAINPINLFKQL